MAEHPISNTAICYCRTSSKGQRDRDTIAVQKKVCSEILRRHGLTLLPYGVEEGGAGDGWIIDDGISGTLLAGRAFSTLIEDLRAGRIKPGYLVMYDVNRIARPDRYSAKREKIIESQDDMGRILGALMSSGVWVIDRDGKMDPRSGAFAYAIQKGGDQYVTLRENTTNGKRSRLEDGESSMSGKLPYGYRRTTRDPQDKRRHVEANPEEAERLRRILGWYIEGGETFAARQATEAGIPVPRAHVQRKKGPLTAWLPQSVRSMIERVQIYNSGIIHGTFEGAPYQVSVPKLIDDALFVKVNNRRTQRTLKRRATFLSTGFLKCSCGATIQNRAYSKYHHTRCDVCRRSIRQVAFDRRLLASLVCRLIQIQTAAPVTSKTDDAARLAEIEKKVEDVTAKITRLSEARLDGLDRDVWRVQNEKLNAEKLELLSGIERIRADREAAVKREVQRTSVLGRIAQVRWILTEDPNRDLETTRTILGDLLGPGVRLVVAWKYNKEGATVPLMTWPAWGDLPPVTVRMDARQWPQMLPDHTPDVVPRWDM